MKRKDLIICLLCLLTQLSLGQVIKPNFGKYTLEDFTLIKYEKDTIAEAVILSDIGQSDFADVDGRFYLYFERTTRYKVLSEAGLKYAEISIPFYTGDDDAEEIVSIKGNTANFENGLVKTTPLSIKNSYIEKHNENWSSKKFAMPDVKVGSVFEINYIIKSPYFFNLRSWEFQSTIPVINSQYTTKMIPFYSYIYLLQGASKFDFYQCDKGLGMSRRFGSIEYQDMVYVFGMKNLPAFRDEAFITSPDDNIIKLNYQLSTIYNYNGGTRNIMTTWPKLCSEMLDYEFFGKYIKQSTKKAEEIIASLKLDTMCAISKAKLIDHYVKANYNWNGHSSKYSTQNIKEFLLKKTGNAAEINLFLLAMLKTAGIDAYPVVISTRDHGRIFYDYPFDHFFNYVIVEAQINNEIVLFDATEPLCAFSEIPTRCINDRGLIIQKDKVEWLNIRCNALSSTFYTFDLTPTPEIDSTLEKCNLSTSGFEAMNYRRQYLTALVDLKKKLLGANSLSSDTIITENITNIEKPFNLIFNNKIPLDAIDNKIIIQPFPNTILSENPLKQPTRKYPIDFIYKKTCKFRSFIAIPKGYKLIQKAENLTVNNDKIQIIYTVTPNDTAVVVEAIYKFKKEMYDASDYANLKSYFDVIIDKFNQSVVLGKE